jgi:uncharacterized protein with von Willebrand factor type A (vWA) domain
MEEPATQNIVHDSFDTGKFTKMFYGTELNQNITAGIAEYKQFPELAQDLFYSLYKYSPQLTPPDRMDREYLMNREMVEKAMGTQNWAQLRSYSKLNDASAAIAAATLSENILKENADKFKQLHDQQQKAAANKDQLKQLAEELQKLKAQPQSSAVQRMENQLTQKAQQKLAQQQTLQTQMQATAAGIGITKPMQTTAEEIKTQEDLFHGYGGDETGGSVQKVNIQDRLKFGQLFIGNPRFQKLVRMLGKYHRMAEKKQREKTRHANETIDDVKQSRDLTHMVASEGLLLTDPDLETVFDKKFADAGLLTYELTGQIEKGKGPIVCALDISGSMTGDKDLTAKAIALAMVHIAHKQHRAAYIMLFDVPVVYEAEFPAKDPEFWDKLMKMVSVFTGGGTSYNPVVKRAMAIFTTEKLYTKADFLIITDMDYGFAEKVKMDYLDLKAERKITTYLVLVDRAFLNIDRHDLAPIADQKLTCDSLTDDIAGALFESV